MNVTWTRGFGPLLAAFLIMAVAFATPADARRVAFVLGNGDYEAVTPLNNPVNDAGQMADTLESLDFEVVYLANLGSADLWAELNAFVDRGEDIELALFYYSGHAFQMNGANFLVPVDARLTDMLAIATQTWELTQIVERLERLNTDTLIVLDACRNNPLPESMRENAGTGLSRIETGNATKFVYATQPGEEAYEGTGDTSFFTRALLDNITAPGASVEDVIIRVRNQVKEETRSRQIPWAGGILSRAVYLKPEAQRQDRLSAADLENILRNFDEAARDAVIETLVGQNLVDRTVVEEALVALAPEVNIEAVEERTRINPQGDVIGLAAVDWSLRPVGRPALPEPETIVAEAVVDPAPIEEEPRIAEVPAEPEAPEDEIIVAGAPIVIVEGEDLGETMSPRPVRVLRPVAISTKSVSGQAFAVDERLKNSRLAQEQPDLVAALVAPDLSATELATAAQTQLERLGCYRMRIDGDWGRGSRYALTSYYLAKGVVFDSLEPTVPLLRQLEAEPRVVCRSVEAAAPVSASVVKKVSDLTSGATSNRPRPAAGRGQIKTEEIEAIESGERAIGIRVFR